MTCPDLALTPIYFGLGVVFAGIGVILIALAKDLWNNF